MIGIKRHRAFYWDRSTPGGDMSESLMQQPLGAILDALASRAPTPGGGSVAALTGAMAAGLVSMVCELTIGKPQFAEMEDELRTIHARLSNCATSYSALPMKILLYLTG
jgi:Formimidoyltetrahydrofolate cyclodeaminase (EC 4.3.1.4)